MKGKMIICVQCDTSFEFTVTEQQEFSSRGFDFPKRCPQCRKKKAKLGGAGEVWRDKVKKKNARYDYDDEEF